METGENLALGVMLLLPCLLAWGLRAFFAHLRHSPVKSAQPEPPPFTPGGW